MTNDCSSPILESSLPAPLAIPMPWPYGKKWIDKHMGSYEKKEIIDDACGISGAGNKLNEFFTYSIPRALEKIAIQNSLVDQLSDGKIVAHKLSKIDVDWQSGNTWARHFELKAVLFDAYNARLCGKDILEAINFVWDLFGAARKHAEELISYIEFQSAEYERKKDCDNTKALNEIKLSRDFARERQSSENKWQSIDIEHSKVESGFVYVLSNDLMPGVNKIGFTAGSPDKRATQISKQYGLPSPFLVLKYWRTSDPYLVEQKIHNLLSDKKKSGEFFEVNFDSIVEIVNRLILHENQ